MDFLTGADSASTALNNSATTFNNIDTINRNRNANWWKAQTDAVQNYSQFLAQSMIRDNQLRQYQSHVTTNAMQSAGNPSELVARLNKMEAENAALRKKQEATGVLDMIKNFFSTRSTTEINSALNKGDNNALNMTFGKGSTMMPVSSFTPEAIAQIRDINGVNVGIEVAKVMGQGNQPQSNQLQGNQPQSNQQGNQPQGNQPNQQGSEVQQQGNQQTQLSSGIDPNDYVVLNIPGKGQVLVNLESVAALMGMDPNVIQNARDIRTYNDMVSQNMMKSSLYQNDAVARLNQDMSRFGVTPYNAANADLISKQVSTNDANVKATKDMGDAINMGNGTYGDTQAMYDPNSKIGVQLSPNKHAIGNFSTGNIPKPPSTSGSGSSGSDDAPPRSFDLDYGVRFRRALTGDPTAIKQFRLMFEDKSNMYPNDIKFLESVEEDLRTIAQSYIAQGLDKTENVEKVFEAFKDPAVLEKEAQSSIRVLEDTITDAHNKKLADISSGLDGIYNELFDILGGEEKVQELLKYTNSTDFDTFIDYNANNRSPGLLNSPRVLDTQKQFNYLTKEQKDRIKQLSKQFQELKARYRDASNFDLSLDVQEAMSKTLLVNSISNEARNTSSNIAGTLEALDNLDINGEKLGSLLDSVNPASNVGNKVTNWLGIGIEGEGMLARRQEFSNAMNLLIGAIATGVPGNTSNDDITRTLKKYGISANKDGTWEDEIFKNPKKFKTILINVLSGLKQRANNAGKYVGGYYITPDIVAVRKLQNLINALNEPKPTNLFKETRK